jgi:hypothetical protein
VRTGEALAFGLIVLVSSEFSALVITGAASVAR